MRLIGGKNSHFNVFVSSSHWDTFSSNLINFAVSSAYGFWNDSRVFKINPRVALNQSHLMRKIVRTWSFSFKTEWIREEKALKNLIYGFLFQTSYVCKCGVCGDFRQSTSAHESMSNVNMMLNENEFSFFLSEWKGKKKIAGRKHWKKIHETF